MPAAVPIDKVLYFPRKFVVLWRHAAESAVRHCLEHVEFGLYASCPQCAVHSHCVRKEQIACPRLEKGRREAGNVTEQWRQVWMCQVVPIRIETIDLQQWLKN